MITYKFTSIKENFWAAYPEYRLIKEFKAFYEGDTSKDKATTSLAMWAMLLYCHPKSPFYPLSDKEDRIAKDLLKDVELWEDLKTMQLLTLFEETTLSEAERSLVQWEELMRGRRVFLQENPYHKQNIKLVDTLERMAANTHKLFADYVNIKKQLDELDKSGVGVKGLGDAKDF